MVFQMFIPGGKALHIEISVTDKDKVKRRIIFHSGANQSIVINPLHARVPISCFKRDQWLNLSIDVFAFAHYCFKGIEVKSIDLIQLTSTCRLRKIFTMRSPLLDDEMNTDEQLLNALDSLTMDEFGGDSSQILFENVPKNMEYATGIVYANQFIFPHRIQLRKGNEQIS